MSNDGLGAMTTAPPELAVCADCAWATARRWLTAARLAAGDNSGKEAATFHGS